MRSRSTDRRTLVITAILLGRVALLRVAAAVAEYKHTSAWVHCRHSLERSPIDVVMPSCYHTAADHERGKTHTFVEDIVDPGCNSLGLPLRNEIS